VNNSFARVGLAVMSEARRGDNNTPPRHS